MSEVAVRLLKLMGHSGTVPSALFAEDIPAALAPPQVAIKAVNTSNKTDDSREGGDDKPAVSLPHRALPPIELLKAAAKEKCNAMWNSNNQGVAEEVRRYLDFLLF
jgi:hypothetical protein